MSKEIHRDETRSAAPYSSPGLVRDNEIILRTVWDPIHLENGHVGPAAISLDDLRERGWSVDRRSYTCPRRLKKAHAKKCRQKPNIKACHVVPIGVRDIRAIVQSQGVRSFVVTDEALPDNPAHAVVLAAARKQSESRLRALRVELLKILPPHIKVDDAFANEKGGCLKALMFQATARLRYLYRRFNAFSKQHTREQS